MKELVSLVIINWNNKAYIKRCVDSIKNQTYENIELIFIDNDSKDGSFEYFQEEYSKDGFIAQKNEKNLGYSGAANQGIRMAKGQYLMIINPDIIMEPDFIEKLYEGMQLQENIAAVSGKLLKYDFKNDKKLNYIDSAGIDMYRSRRCVDRGQNEEDKGQYDEVERVFGVCGAAPFYKKEALEVVKIGDEYFDEDFFAYKEDVDLSWRFNLAGYISLYYPKAIAYHGRGLGGSKGGVKDFIKHRKTQSEFLRGISQRNHMMMLMKNETNESFNRDKYKIIKREVAFLGYALFYERFSYKYLMEAYKKKSLMESKKKEFSEKLNNKLQSIESVIKS